MITQGITVKYSRDMERLLSGTWAAEACGHIAKHVFTETIGAGKIAHKHFMRGQSSWPKLSSQTLRNKRKKNRQIFVHSGRVVRALVKRPAEGKLLAWGSSADIRGGGRKSYRYNASGIWAAARVSGDGLYFEAGFAGKLKHSAAFNRMRKKLAVDRGLDLSKIPSRGQKTAIARKVSVRDTHVALKKTGKPFRKFQAAGSLGIKGKKHVLARGDNNLAYANVVQAGRFLGVKDNKTGVFFKPDIIHGSKISKDYTPMRGKHPRQLLPYQSSDTSALQKAMDEGVKAAFRKLGWS